MENIPLRWFKWALAPKENIHTEKKKEDSLRCCSTCTWTKYHLTLSELPKIPERKTEQVITGCNLRTHFQSCSTLWMAATSLSRGLCCGSAQTCWGNSGGRGVGGVCSDCLVFPSGVIFLWPLVVPSPLSICVSLFSRYYTVPPRSVSVILSRAGSPKPY